MCSVLNFNERERVHTNGQPKKSSPKKSKRLKAIENSFEVLIAIAQPKLDRDETDEEANERITGYLDDASLPLGEDTADFFVPDADEIVFLVEALTHGPEVFAITVAALKAQNFMHGHIHAQIQDGKRSKDGSLL